MSPLALLVATLALSAGARALSPGSQAGETPRASLLDLDPPVVVRVDLSVDEQRLNEGVDERCAETADALKEQDGGDQGLGPEWAANGARVNMAPLMMKAEHPVRAPCLDKRENDRCTVRFEGSTLPGMCSLGFVRGADQPLCIPGEVLVAPHSCQEADEPAGAACQYVMLEETYRGVCAHDPTGTMRGCMTERASRFLHWLQDAANTGFASVRGNVTLDGGTEFANVKARRHGGSSLLLAWEAGSQKRPLQLDFGEATTPVGAAAPGTRVSAQGRGLLGVRKVVLVAHQETDASLLRDALAARVLDALGVLAPRVGFVRLYVNGKYHGMYTAVEDFGVAGLAQRLLPAASPQRDPAPPQLPLQRSLGLHVVTTAWAAVTDTEMSVDVGDKLIVLDDSHDKWLLCETASPDADTRTGWIPRECAEREPCGRFHGTLYAPASKLHLLHPQEFLPLDGTAPARWYDDGVRLWAALGDEGRQAQPGAWRRNVTTVFNVDGFLRWLAANTVLGNWDAYGYIEHNYRLYAEPCTGRLHFVAEDFDQVFSRAPDRVVYADPLHASVGRNWPLIRSLLDDDVFFLQYIGHLEAAVAFTSVPQGRLAGQVQRWHDHIAPFVDPDQPTGEDPDFTEFDYDDFASSVKGLAAAIRTRARLVGKSLAGDSRAARLKGAPRLAEAARNEL